MTTAAAVIIGNEILSAKFPDRNTPWLARRCRLLGVDLVRVVVIPDDVRLIGEEVARCAASADWVFTTGGVGPTHDDMTMAGVAAAFGLELVRHPELEAMLIAGLGEGATAAALRMADVPEGAELWWGGELRFPQVIVSNVCIFPGVPELLQRKFKSVEYRFAGTPLQSRALETTARESEIADVLAEAERTHGEVSIGSYPQFRRKPYTVKVTLDSRNEAQLDACLVTLQAALGDSLIGADPPR